MILPENPLVQEVPKIIQPRNHKAKVCVWADLTVDDLDRVNESLNADHIKQVLADIFHLDDYKENLKTGIVMDLYYYTLQFARDNAFSKEQTSTLFSIIKKTHEVCIETPFGNIDQTFNYFKELVLCHAVNRPPHSIELFTADHVRMITEYTVNTYFRHFKMYKYAFTPLVRLDLTLSYVGIPETPPPSEADEPDAGLEAEQGELTGDSETPAVAPERPTEPEESPERKELRTMIQTYLTEEVKKIKASVDSHLKSTEDLLNKKLDIAEGGGASTQKGGRGSAKGKKK
ncbi:hypothetical protein ACJMK2_011477 [Sinanodonta woodiana]|uniref:Coiled-coil domain-containing protein 189 n=1 Tax=Sinanodonta woodiana TaxID=1069815 RepID=A0ABD3V6X2_SINWO